MRRRSKPGREPVKARRHKAAPPKHRTVPKAMHRRSSSGAQQETNVARLTRELHEALEQQTTAEVLKGHQRLRLFKRNRARFHWWLPSRNLKVRIGAQKQEIGASQQD